MARKEIAIEIGTTHTSVFLAGNGVVLKEPSVVAVTKNEKNKVLKSIGFNALALEGKTGDNTVLIYPVKEGIIVDEDACATMLRGFLKKLIPNTAVFYPKYKVILCVPIGLSTKERYHFENVCIKASLDDITIVDSIMATAVGIDLSVDQPRGNIVVNIGGGKTEIAVISDCQIVSGLNVAIGGNSIDSAIIDYVASRYNMSISHNQACNIKVEIGGLYSNDISEMVVQGTDLSSKEVVKYVIRAVDVAECIEPLVATIISNIDMVLKKCSPDIIENVYNAGIYLCGGVSLLEGVDKMISNVLGIKVWKVENPEFASIIGAGKLVTSELLSEIIAK